MLEETENMSFDKQFEEAIQESEAYRAALTRKTLLDNLIEMTLERKQALEQHKTVKTNNMLLIEIRHLNEVWEELKKARDEHIAQQEKKHLPVALSQKGDLSGSLIW